MYLSRLILFYFLVCLTIKSSKSYAFDPFTASMATSSIMDRIDEASNVGFALTDLLSEVGIQNDNGNDLNSAIDSIRGYHNEVKDAQWNTTDISEAISRTLENGESLERRMNSLKNAVQASKKIAGIMGVRPKAADGAAKIQEIRISSMMLEELQSIRKAQYLAYLEDKDAKIKREIYLQKILNQSEKGRGSKP